MVPQTEISSDFVGSDRIYSPGLLNDELKSMKHPFEILPFRQAALVENFIFVLHFAPGGAVNKSVV